MDATYGKITAPIWLIGDSAPKRANLVRHPLDRRHPAIHNIWTPILYGIQKHIYAEKATIITNEEDIFFIKNAALDAGQKPQSNSKNWEDNKPLMERLEATKKDLAAYNPKLVITFGACAYEFMRRCYIQDKNKWHHSKYWGARTMGADFRAGIKESKILLPLLHVSISQGKWPQSHEQYTDYVAANLYKRIIITLNL